MAPQNDGIRTHHTAVWVKDAIGARRFVREPRPPNQWCLDWILAELHVSRVEMYMVSGACTSGCA